MLGLLCFLLGLAMCPLLIGALLSIEEMRWKLRIKKYREECGSNARSEQNPSQEHLEQERKLKDDEH